MMECNIGKNSRTERPAEVIRFNHLRKIKGLPAAKVDRMWLMAPWSVRQSSIRIWTDHGSRPNGMKLASELLLDQLPAQVLAGFHHEREALGTPLLDPRLCPMRTLGVDKQGL